MRCGVVLVVVSAGLGAFSVLVRERGAPAGEPVMRRVVTRASAGWRSAVRDDGGFGFEVGCRKRSRRKFDK